MSVLVIEAVMHGAAGLADESLLGRFRKHVVIARHQVQRVVIVAIEQGLDFLPLFLDSGIAAPLDGVAYVDDKRRVQHIDLAPDASVDLSGRRSGPVADDREVEVVVLAGGGAKRHQANKQGHGEQAGDPVPVRMGHGAIVTQTANNPGKL